MNNDNYMQLFFRLVEMEKSSKRFYRADSQWDLAKFWDYGEHFAHQVIVLPLVYIPQGISKAYLMSRTDGALSVLGKWPTKWVVSTQS